MTDIFNTSQDLLSIYWPNRTPAKERTEAEDDAIQNWLAAYHNDWETEDDVVLTAFEYEECPEPPDYEGNFDAEQGHYAEITVSSDDFGTYPHAIGYEDEDYVAIGESTILAAMSNSDEDLGDPNVILSAQSQAPVVAALTFLNLPFSETARIHKAVIVVKAHEGINSFAPYVITLIRAHCSGDTDHPNNELVLDTMTRTWIPVEWEMPDPWTVDDIYETPNLAYILNEVKSLPSWDSGVTFLFDQDTPIDSYQTNSFYSVEGGYPAELQVWWNETYEETPTGGVKLGGRFQQNVGGAQELNPTSDIDTGTWIVAPLYPKIDETYPDDVDFISSAHDPTASTCEVLLEPGLDPQVSTGHVVYYRYSKSDPDYTMNLTVRLLQGATLIAEWTHSNIPFHWTEVEQTLTTMQADSITDYSDLRLKFIANTV